MHDLYASLLPDDHCDEYGKIQNRGTSNDSGFPDVGIVDLNFDRINKNNPTRAAQHQPTTERMTKSSLMRKPDAACRSDGRRCCWRDAGPGSDDWCRRQNSATGL